MNPIQNINVRLADESLQRKIRIRLIERETAEMAPIWQQKQALLYPTALPISQTPTLGQVITEETQKNAMNHDVLYQRAEQKLLQIADKVNVEHILDRLVNEELYVLNNTWDGILKEIKEKYASKGLDKDVFISIVKDKTANLANDVLSTTFSGKQFPLTTKAQIKEQQKQDALDELQDRVDTDRFGQKLEKQMSDDLVNKRQKEKEIEDERILQEQILREQQQKALLSKMKSDRIKAALKKVKILAASQSASPATMTQPAAPEQPVT